MRGNTIIVNSYLDDLGVKHSNLGYRYLMEAICSIIENPDEGIRITEVYDKIADKFNTSTMCVERAIRYTIQNKNKTNKEFISKASDDIRFAKTS